MKPVTAAQRGAPPIAASARKPATSPDAFGAAFHRANANRNADAQRAAEPVDSANSRDATQTDPREMRRDSNGVDARQSAHADARRSAHAEEPTPAPGSLPPAANEPAGQVDGRSKARAATEARDGAGLEPTEDPGAEADGPRTDPVNPMAPHVSAPQTPAPMSTSPPLSTAEADALATAEAVDVAAATAEAAELATANSVTAELAAAAGLVSPTAAELATATTAGLATPTAAAGSASVVRVSEPIDAVDGGQLSWTAEAGPARGKAGGGAGPGDATAPAAISTAAAEQAPVSGDLHAHSQRPSVGQPNPKTIEASVTAGLLAASDAAARGGLSGAIVLDDAGADLGMNVWADRLRGATERAIEALAESPDAVAQLSTQGEASDLGGDGEPQNGSTPSTPVSKQEKHLPGFQIPTATVDTVSSPETGQAWSPRPTARVAAAVEEIIRGRANLSETNASARVEVEVDGQRISVRVHVRNGRVDVEVGGLDPAELARLHDDLGEQLRGHDLTLGDLTQDTGRDRRSQREADEAAASDAAAETEAIADAAARLDDARRRHDGAVYVTA